MLPDFSEAPLGAEFPHDNPELFSGPGWIAVEPCGGPKAIVWASQRNLHYRQPEATPAQGPKERGGRDAPVAASPCVASLPSDATEPAGALCAELTDFDRFVAALLSVLPSDVDPAVAAAIEQFLRDGSLPGAVLTPRARDALVARGFASVDARGWFLDARASETAGAWRRLLSGRVSDLAVCGDRPLDEWAAVLAGACLGYDGSATAALRLALRKRKVAAFGMLSA